VKKIIAFTILVSLFLSSCSLGKGTGSQSNDTATSIATTNPGQKTTPKANRTPKANHTPKANRTPKAHATATVTIANNQIDITSAGVQPLDLTVAVGTTVTWVNQDSVDRTFVDDADLITTGVIAPNGQYQYLFSQAGTFVFHDGNNTAMVITIVVTP